MSRPCSVDLYCISSPHSLVSKVDYRVSSLNFQQFSIDECFVHYYQLWFVHAKSMCRIEVSPDKLSPVDGP